MDKKDYNLFEFLELFTIISNLEMRAKPANSRDSYIHLTAPENIADFAINVYYSQCKSYTAIPIVYPLIWEWRLSVR